MPISPQLLRKLRETLGADAADDLVSRMEDMDAYRGDVGELRHEMQLGFARVDARFDRLESNIDTRFERSEGNIDARSGNTESRFAKLEANIDARFGNSELRFEKFEAKME